MALLRHSTLPHSVAPDAKLQDTSRGLGTGGPEYGVLFLRLCPVKRYINRSHLSTGTPVPERGFYAKGYSNVYCIKMKTERPGQRQGLSYDLLFFPPPLAHQDRCPRAWQRARARAAPALPPPAYPAHSPPPGAEPHSESSSLATRAGAYCASTAASSLPSATTAAWRTPP